MENMAPQLFERGITISAMNEELEKEKAWLERLLEHYADSRSMPAFYKTKDKLREVEKKIRESSEGGGQVEL